MKPAPRIIRRIDAALGKMRVQGMEPRAIYLTLADYRLLARSRTTRYRRETGSRALVWPCSHDDVPLISAKLIDKMVPVRPTLGATRRSTVFSTNGVSVAVPKLAPEMELAS
jgi:hypothetical protein